MSEISKPSDWLQCELGELTEIILGGTPSTAIPAFWGGTIPWMSSGDVHRKIIRDVPGRITKRGLESSNARLVNPPTVAVALAGQGKTRGTAALVQATLSTNQSVALLRPIDERLDARFLYFNLDHRYEELRNRSMGGGRAGLSGGVLAKVPIALPPRDVQWRIAEILDAVDDQVVFARDALAKLRLQAIGVLEDLVAAIPTGKREPLADLCTADICYGIVQSGKFVADGVPVLSIRDLSGDFETGLHRTNSAIDAQSRRSRIVPRDVLLSIKGTIGRVGVAPEHYVGNISRELARLRFGKNVLPGFARSYFLSREAQRRLDLAVVGTTRAEVSIHVLKKFGFPVPSLAYQQRMIDAYSCIEKRILAEEQELLKLRALKLGLADDLLTGRVRVPAEGPHE